MTPRARKTLIVAGAAILAVAGAVLLQPVWRKAELARACHDATSVVVDANVGFPSPLGAELPKWTVTGSDRVKTLLAAIHLRRQIPPVRCMCRGELVFRFMRDDAELATVSLHHGTALRWRHGAWMGDAPLTAESCSAVQTWLAQNDCPSLEAVIALQTAILDAQRAALRDEAASQPTSP